MKPDSSREIFGRFGYNSWIVINYNRLHILLATLLEITRF